MRVFIGGVMQGSVIGKGIVDQDYRRQIADAMIRRWPALEIIDPFQLHPNSVEYETDQARETLLAMAALAGRSDLVVVYLPVASMGTALEMVEAYHAGVPVVAVSPMAENWVVRALANRVYPDMPEFVRAVDACAEPGDLAR